MISERIERSYLEPPLETSVWVECIGCHGDIMDEEAVWEEDLPFCCVLCRDAYLRFRNGETDKEGDE